MTRAIQKYNFIHFEKVFQKLWQYRRIFLDVTFPRQRKNWSIMAVQGAIAGDHFYYKRERNFVLQVE